MRLPKIKFKRMSLEENIEVIKWSYYEKTDTLDIHSYTIEYFPELANLSSDLPKEDIYKIIDKVVSDTYDENLVNLDKEVERYNKLWESYNDKYFQTLSNYLNIDWPKDLITIEATVGLMPIFPRYLDSFSFSVTPNLDNSKLIGIAAHETLHFLWFEKWKKLYPQIPRKEYDSSYIAWQYSEMVTDAILNDKTFREVFDFEEKSYDSFYQLHDGDLLVMDKLKEIYNQAIPIEDKICKGFEYIKKIVE